MALAGPGISRLGLFHVATDLATGRLVPLLEDCNPGDLELIYAIHVGSGPLPRRDGAFIQYMIEMVEQSPLLKAS